MSTRSRVSKVASVLAVVTWTAVVLGVAPAGANLPPGGVEEVYVSLPRPCVVKTGTIGPIGPTSIAVKVKGVCAVPSEAVAVSAALTAGTPASAMSPGTITAMPTGAAPIGGVVTVSYGAAPSTNTGDVKLCAGACASDVTLTGAGGATSFVLSVNGYYAPSADISDLKLRVTHLENLTPGTSTMVKDVLQLIDEVENPTTGLLAVVGKDDSHGLRQQVKDLVNETPNSSSLVADVLDLHGKVYDGTTGISSPTSGLPSRVTNIETESTVPPTPIVTDVLALKKREVSIGGHVPVGGLTTADLNLTSSMDSGAGTFTLNFDRDLTGCRLAVSPDYDAAAVYLVFLDFPTVSGTSAIVHETDAAHGAVSKVGFTVVGTCPS